MTVIERPLLGEPAHDHLVHASRLRSGISSPLASGSKRVMFCAMVPSNSSMSCGRYRRLLTATTSRARRRAGVCAGAD